MREFHELQLMRHELAHGLANLHYGAQSVTIRAGDGYFETLPKWTTEPGEDAAIAGFLAGRLAIPVAGCPEDDFVLDNVGDDIKFRLWTEVIVPRIKPKLDAIDDETLTRMLDTIDRVGAILLEPDVLQ